MGARITEWKASQKGGGVALPLEALQLEGRMFHVKGNNTLQFEWSASSIRGRFRGTSIAMEVEVLQGGFDSFAVLLNGSLSSMVSVNGSGSGPTLVTLATDLPPDADHEVCVTKITEPQVATTSVSGFDLGSNGRWLERPPPRERRIQIIGDSISCGFGVECASREEVDPDLKHENVMKSYGVIAGRVLSAEVRIAAWSGRGLLQNADGSRNGTMPHLMDCVLPNWRPSLSSEGDGWRPDAVVINLLTNDLAAEHQDGRKEVTEAYKALLLRLRAPHPHHPEPPLVVLALGPMINDGWPLHRAGDLDRVRRIIRRLAASYPSRVVFAEFPEQNKRPDLPVGCTAHPGAQMHRIMAQVLSDTLRQQLNW